MNEHVIRAQWEYQKLRKVLEGLDFESVVMTARLKGSGCCTPNCINEEKVLRALREYKKSILIKLNSD